MNQHRHLLSEIVIEFRSSTETIICSFLKTPSLLFVVIVLFVVVVANHVLLSQGAIGNSKAATPTPTLNSIPFILIHPDDPTRAIHGSFEKYQNEVTQAMKGLSQALEKALALEQLQLQRPRTVQKTTTTIPPQIRLSFKIRQRIERMNQSFEEDERVLKQLLLLTSSSSSWESQNTSHEPYTTRQMMIRALPDQPIVVKTDPINHSWSDNDDKIQTSPKAHDQPPSTIFQFVDHSQQFPLDGNVYDSAAQVIAHLVRDWTTAGTLVRRNLYDWCLQQLDTYHQDRTEASPVLVPGAGMGRLAYDLCQKGGYVVEANELSPVMATAAHAILERQMSGIVHPYIMDILSNEVDSNRRYDAVAFPDTAPKTMMAAAGRLSFTVGDFVGDYYASQNAAFGAIVTCFFIDTATNIYEYLDLIQQLLKKGGVWINVGPVQWHRNALLHPSVDELKELISGYNFRVLHWTVDREPVPYRQDDDDKVGNQQTGFVRTTNYDAYRPLRFVAIRV